MSLIKWFEKRRRRRRDRIYEGPYIDGGTRISYDTDAPKEIVSHELKSFYCRYSTLSLIDDTVKPDRGIHHFKAERGEGGESCSISYNCNTANKKTEKEISSVALLEKLDALLIKYNVSKHNGYYYKVSGLPSFYGAAIDAEYVSGETIYCYNNQDPFIPIEFLQELYDLFGLSADDEK